MDQSDRREALTPYDIFKHGVNVRVYDSAGRYGRVVEIRETAPEWIEPIVLWDDMTTPMRSSTKLFLEPTDLR